jgi:hypothetical protein
MATLPFKQRLEALEAEVARLKAKVDSGSDTERPWWDQIWGTFAEDPAFQEAMALGRQYRESLRPKRASDRKS